MNDGARILDVLGPAALTQYNRYYERAYVLSVLNAYDEVGLPDISGYAGKTESDYAALQWAGRSDNAWLGDTLWIFLTLLDRELRYGANGTTAILSPNTGQRAHFVNPSTLEPFANEAEFEALIGPKPTGTLRHDNLEFWNWWIAALDQVYLVKYDVANGVAPTVSFRQFSNSGAQNGYIWPWYQPDRDGGTKKTTSEPAIVESLQFAHREVEPIDAWPNVLHSEQLVSDGEARGFYYKAGYTRTTGLGLETEWVWHEPPLNRGYCSWRVYAKATKAAPLDPYVTHNYAQVVRSTVRSTLTDMTWWPRVQPYVTSWKWKFYLDVGEGFVSSVTFSAESATERYDWTVAPGAVYTPTVEFTTSPVDVWISSDLPAAAPAPYETYPNDHVAGLAIEQRPVDPIYIDIRPYLTY